MAIPFTQFKRPNGRQVGVTIERPAGVEEQAHALLKAGCRFEIEELSTGHISMECVRGEQAIAAELCGNGPAVLEAVDRMIAAAYAATEGRR